MDKKSILVVTVGNSDIQISDKKYRDFTIENSEGDFYLFSKEKHKTIIELLRNRADKSTYILKSCRFDSEKIKKNYNLFRPILRFPIIEPLIKYLKKEATEIDTIWLVYTDQEDENFRRSDTVYAKDIIQRFLKEIMPAGTRFNSLKVSKNLTDIDFQYNEFSKIKSSPFAKLDNIEKAYLFPQGGMDQINQALTLQFIQAFQDRAVILQKPEGADLRELKFPSIFLKELNKQKIIKHLEDYDFEKASELMYDDYNKEVCLVASYRLTLNYDKISSLNLSPDVRKYLINTEKCSIEEHRLKLTDLIYSIKINYFVQKRYGDTIWRIYTLLENIYKNFVDSYCNVDTKNYFSKECYKDPRKENINWNELLKVKFGEDILQKLDKKDIKYNNPNAFTYYYLFRWLNDDKLINIFITDDEIKKCHKILIGFRDLRNDLAHNLGSVSKEDIKLVFQSKKVTESDFFEILDKFYSTNKYGIFNEIKDTILSSYN
jgi:hypothetical protein